MNRRRFLSAKALEGTDLLPLFDGQGCESKVVEEAIGKILHPPVKDKDDDELVGDDKPVEVDQLVGEITWKVQTLSSIAGPNLFIPKSIQVLTLAAENDTSLLLEYLREIHPTARYGKTVWRPVWEDLFFTLGMLPKHGLRPLLLPEFAKLVCQDQDLVRSLMVPESPDYSVEFLFPHMVTPSNRAGFYVSRILTVEADYGEDPLFNLANPAHFVTVGGPAQKRQVVKTFCWSDDVAE